MVNDRNASNPEHIFELYGIIIYSYSYYEFQLRIIIKYYHSLLQNNTKMLGNFSTMFGKAAAVSAFLGHNNHKNLCELHEGLMSCSPWMYSALPLCIQSLPHMVKASFISWLLIQLQDVVCVLIHATVSMLCSFFFSNIIQPLSPNHLYMPVCSQRCVLHSPIQYKPAAIVWRIRYWEG